MYQVRQCRGSGCGKSAGFNFPQAEAKADYCEEHRLQGMVSLRARECEVMEYGIPARLVVRAALRQRVSCVVRSTTRVCFRKRRSATVEHYSQCLPGAVFDRRCDRWLGVATAKDGRYDSVHVLSTVKGPSLETRANSSSGIRGQGCFLSN